MKALFLSVVLCFVSSWAHAEIDDSIDSQAGRAWVCTMSFKGVSKGIQIVVGSFTTKAFGKLKCVGASGETYSRNIRVDISSYKVGPTIGIGYFKMAGVSSKISLFNERPEKILGNYSTTQYEVAVGAGAGYFTATKVGLPQFAYNISVQLLGGIGIKVGIEKMRISAID